jgi:hypothetical protein
VQQEPRGVGEERHRGESGRQESQKPEEGAHGDEVLQR